MRIVGVELPTRDLEGCRQFYGDLLGFAVRQRDSASLTLEIAGTTIRFLSAGGRTIPNDSRSNDLWFRHLAVVVRDIEGAYEMLRSENVDFVSPPVALPDWNPSTAGIRAAYFRDHERRPVELIWLPDDKRREEVIDNGRERFLGIDHTAISVRDLARSEAYYRRRFALAAVARSRNVGHEQEMLSGVTGADVSIASLRGEGGVGIELLQYNTPFSGRDIPPDSDASDLWSGVTCFANAGQECEGSGATFQDPDGHRVRIVR